MRREAEQTETLRHDADHYVVFPVQSKSTADERTVGTEAPVPKLVAKYDDVVASGLVFAGFERAPELRCDTENAEIIGRNRCGTERLWLGCRGGVILRGQTNGSILIGSSHILENLVCFAPTQVVGSGDETRVGMESRRRVHGTNHGDALWVADRRTPQQKSADETEHRGIHGDAQRQREHCSNCESGILE